MRESHRWRRLGGSALCLTLSACAAPPKPTPALEAPSGPQQVAAVDGEPGAPAPRPTPVSNASSRVIALTVMQVLVPMEQRRSADMVWNHLREDLFDAETSVRLRANGLRVGIGHEQWWAPIRAVLEALDGAETFRPEPQAMRPDLPLMLELDDGPRDQMLFSVDGQGALSGGSWPNSRNGLRVQAASDGLQGERTALRVLPLVVQYDEGVRWAREEQEGPWRLAANQRVAPLPSATFDVQLAPGEFLLVAPSENAGVLGLVGNAFLTRSRDQRAFATYLFLQPEGKSVSRRSE